MWGREPMYLSWARLPILYLKQQDYISQFLCLIRTIVLNLWEF